MVDERFIMHRYKATRLSVAVGVILMAGYFFYEFVAHRLIRWDLFVIMASMAVVKVVAMLYLRRTN
jgi:hypothetical protein